MTALTRNAGLVADPLFVGLTRPPMRWGVTYSALLLNLVCVFEAFVITRQLFVLALVLPIHGICALLCAREARIFELLVLWVRSRAASNLGLARVLGASSTGPLGVRVGWKARAAGPVLVVP
jgi:type IV secretion system protein VirB3